MVVVGESIALDASTTALALARHLKPRGGWLHLTVITNGLRIAAGLEVPRQGEGGRARVEGDALAVDDHRRSSAADRVLLGSLEALADVERTLGAGPVGDDGATVGPDEPALLLEEIEVLADRDARHAEQQAQLRHAGTTVLLDDPRDVLLALLGEHVAVGRLDGHGHLSWTGDGVRRRCESAPYGNRNRNVNKVIETI